MDLSQLMALPEVPAGPSGARMGVSAQELSALPEIPNAQPGAAPTLMGEARGITNRFLKETTNLGGNILDALQFAGTGLAGALGAELTPTQIEQAKAFDSAEKLRAIWNERGFNAEPQTELGRGAATVGEYLVNAALPIGGVAERTLAAALSGTGAGAMRELGAGPGGEIAGALIAPALPTLTKALLATTGRQIGTIWRALTPGGQETLAAQRVQALAGPGAAQTLERALAGQVQTPLTPYVTAAELAADPGIAQLQFMLAQRSGEAKLADALQKSLTPVTGPGGAMLTTRPMARLEQLRALAPAGYTGRTPGELGDVVRTSMEEGIGGAKERASALFEALAGSESKVPTEEAAQVARRQLRDYFGSPSKPPTAETREIVNLLEPTLVKSQLLPPTRPPTLVEVPKTFKYIQDLSSRIAAQSRALGRSGEAINPKERALLAELKNTLDAAVDDAVEAGQASGVDVATWNQAKAGWKTARQLEQRSSISGLLAEYGGGGYKTASERLPDKLLQSPERMDRFLEAVRLGGPNAGDDALNAMRGYVADELTALPQSRWPNFLAKHEESLAKIYRGDFTKLQALIRDVESQVGAGRLGTLGSRGQSITAAYNPVQAIKDTIQFAMRGARYAGGLVGFGTHGPLGATAGFLAGAAGERAVETAVGNINKILVRATFEEPQEMLRLLTMKTPEALSSILKRLARHAGELETAAVFQSTAKYLAAPDQGYPAQQQSAAPGGSNMLISALMDATATPAYASTAGLTEEVMGREDIPDKLLAALAQVESGGNAKAVSKKGAQGMYQIMPATAKAYGLTDPFDPEAAKDTAQSILGDEFDRFGSLELALAAYNAGAPRVQRAIKKAGSKNWDAVAPYLPRETRLYVPKVIKNA